MARTPKNSKGPFTNPGEARDFISYELKKLPTKAGEKGALTNYAQVQCHQTYSLGRLLKRMEAEHLGVKELHAKMLMDVLLTTITDVLREGNSVTIGNFLSIRPVIKGRFDPKGTTNEKQMQLRPVVRCSQAFIKDLNRGVHFHRIKSSDEEESPAQEDS